MRYAFDDADAAERHETQYFEMFCNRGIYHQGWTAVTRHRTPVGHRRRLPAFDDDVWELYDTSTDWTQAHDLAAEQPEKLAELQRLFLIEAREVQRAAARRPPGRALQPRPRRPADADQRATSQLLFGGMGRLTENSVLNLKNKSHSVTAEIDVPEGGADGVIIAQGGAFAGWSLYLQGRQAEVLLQPRSASERFKVEGDAAVPAGEHQVRMEFAYDGGGLAKGGTVTLYVDGTKVGEGRVERDGADGLLRRRDLRRRLRHRHRRSATTTRREGSRFTGTVELGAARRRRGRRGPRPPDHARGAAARRDGAPVAPVPASTARRSGGGGGATPGCIAHGCRADRPT